MALLLLRPPSLGCGCRCNGTATGRNTSGDDELNDRSIKRPGDAKEIEIEIITRDGVITRKVKQELFRPSLKQQQLKGSSIARPRRATEATPPPVPAASRTQEEGVYKPQVSTWGVYPRPSNISKTFGGGRTIRPGEPLETPEEAQAREARTRELLAQYHQKVGLNVDPRTLLECQQAAEEGDAFAKKGALNQAIEMYEYVIERLSFQNELHGEAALQKAICLESLNRSKEARVIYETLRSHPSFAIRKRAKQLAYTFQAAESLKLSKKISTVEPTSYQHFFDSLSRGYGTYDSSSIEPDATDFVPVASIFFFLLILVLGIVVIRILKHH